MLLTDAHRLLMLALVAAACGCSDESTDAGDAGDAGDVGDTLDTDDDGGDGDAGEAIAECEQVAPTTSVSGRVLDEAGNPLGGAAAQMCVRLEISDRLICLAPALSDDDGRFEVSIPVAAQCASEATMRVLEPQADRATVYCHVALDEAGGALALEEPYTLVATTPASELPEYGDADAERTVIFDGGLEVDVTPAELSGGEDAYAELAAVLVDPAAVDVCFVGDSGVFALWAFSPESNVDAAPFAARFPNSTGLAPGTGVDLYVLGGLATTAMTREPLREGEWLRFSTATVSDDGAQIVAERGVPATTWVGLAVSPAAD